MCYCVRDRYVKAGSCQSWQTAISKAGRSHPTSSLWKKFMSATSAQSVHMLLRAASPLQGLRPAMLLRLVGTLALRLAGRVAAFYPLSRAAGFDIPGLRKRWEGAAACQQQNMSEHIQNCIVPLGCTMLRDAQCTALLALSNRCRKKAVRLCCHVCDCRSLQRKLLCLLNAPREQACLSSKKVTCFGLCGCACVLEFWTPCRLNFD